ncbi:unnamed protein product [Peniophora sp. CBMAI 1063]|nr:unnamed protein product [Peniophora sp. CBMAI 1063]
MDNNPDDSLRTLVYLQVHAAPLAVQTYFYAICTGLTAYILYQKWGPGADRRSMPPSAFMVFVTLATFLVFTLLCIIDTYSLWYLAYQSLSDSATDEVTQTSGKLVYIENFVSFPATALMFTLGDVVALWRAYVIVGRPRLLLVLSGCVILGEIASWILTIVLWARLLLGGPYEPHLLADSKTVLVLNIVPFIVTAFVELIATSLIAYKTWMHWKDVREFVGITTIRRSTATLVVVVESGLVYLIFLITYILLFYFPRPNQGVVSLAFLVVFQYSLQSLIFIYPTLVIVLVAARIAVLEHSIHSVDLRSGLRFALPPGGTGSQDHDAPRAQSHRWGPREEDRQQEMSQGSDIILGRDVGFAGLATATNDAEDIESKSGAGTRRVELRASLSLVDVSVQRDSRLAGEPSPMSLP